MTTCEPSLLGSAPVVWGEDLLPRIRTGLQEHPHTLVVIDDDPTGTQTVYDIPVLTGWDQAVLAAELSRGTPCVYVLTNSRGLQAGEASRLNRALGRNLACAAKSTGRRFTVISRSDSTLRGHYPTETDALADVLGPFDGTLLMPFFDAGGRRTVGDVHYVVESGRWTPAAQTPFARDATFGFRESNLRSWVEEKTEGRIRAEDVASISLDEIRRGGPFAVKSRLLSLPCGAVCIVNACTNRDAEVVALATQEAERAGARLLYRTAASFVAARLGLSERRLLAPDDLALTPGAGLIVVGSYVPKTTSQLADLQARHRVRHVELPVPFLLDRAQRGGLIKAAVRDVEDAIRSDTDVVLATSRQLVQTHDAGDNLELGRAVSNALVEVVRRLRIRPRFLVAKGGITSSEIATAALGVKRALVRGQILPGVPVWRLGPESKYPGIDYIVFPGNVGGDDALTTIVARLSSHQHQRRSQTVAP